MTQRAFLVLTAVFSACLSLWSGPHLYSKRPTFVSQSLAQPASPHYRSATSILSREASHVEISDMPPSTTPAGSGDASSKIHAAPTGAPTIFQRLSAVVLSVQFLWALGHLATLLGAAWYLVMRSSPSGPSSYAKAYYGTLLSYGVILYKSHGTPRADQQFLQSVIGDENFWYFALAINWVFSKPLLATLIPYTVFSLFHFLNYFRSEILPALLPPAQFPVTLKANDAILRFIKNYQSRALAQVGAAEIWVIFPTLIIGIFMRWSSFMAPILYFRFMSFRYMTSPVTRQAVADLRVRADALASNPKLPPIVLKSYQAVRDMIIRFGDIQGQAPAQ
ncbi:hypothetical protein HKX48_004673 [Thoreauomyces humboldtii]|nr:hypothetical protein HKX48_004673 [Thoreauomyces humboldtii]